MLLSFALILMLGIFSYQIAQKIGLPGFVGLILLGVAIGPSSLNLISPSLLDLSSDIRRMALILILIKAGLTLDLSTLKKVSRQALLLSFVPASFEMLAYLVLVPLITPLGWWQGGLLGAVMAAVSPAVLVPRMVKLIEEGRGQEHGVPQMLLAGASLDDIFVLSVFSMLLPLQSVGRISWQAFLVLPQSLLLAFVMGAGSTYLLLPFMKRVEGSVRAFLLLLGYSLGLSALENLLSPWVHFSSLLAIMVLAMGVALKGPKVQTQALGNLSGKAWIIGEIFLFFLLGASLEVGQLVQAGPLMLVLIFLCLLVRFMGVWVSLLGSPLNRQEKIFCLFAYMPKATVQAAIGAIPLSMGIEGGSFILATAILGILITAPIGAKAIDILGYEALRS